MDTFVVELHYILLDVSITDSNVSLRTRVFKKTSKFFAIKRVSVRFFYFLQPSNPIIFGGNLEKKEYASFFYQGKMHDPSGQVVFKKSTIAK